MEFVKGKTENVEEYRGYKIVIEHSLNIFEGVKDEDHLIYTICGMGRMFQGTIRDTRKFIDDMIYKYGKEQEMGDREVLEQIHNGLPQEYRRYDKVFICQPEYFKRICPDYSEYQLGQKRGTMEAFKKGSTFWIEKCKDNAGIIYILYRFNDSARYLGDSTGVAESRDEQKIVEVWKRLENL